MIEALARALETEGVEIDAFAMADLLWLARHMADAAPAVPDGRPGSGNEAPGDADAASRADDGKRDASTDAGGGAQAPGSRGLHNASAKRDAHTTSIDAARVEAHRFYVAEDASRIALQTPDAAAPASTVEGYVSRTPLLPNSLELGRALRPFKRGYQSKTRRELDVDATVEHFAETRILVPKLVPGSEPWFDARLVFDASPSMLLWSGLADELTSLFNTTGIFRSVARYDLTHDAHGALALSHGSRILTRLGRGRKADERCLTVILSDCAGQAWRERGLWTALAAWGEEGPTAVAQVLPSRLWRHTALGEDLVAFRSLKSGGANPHLQPQLPWWALAELADEVLIPVISLEEESVAAFAKTIMGVGRYVGTAAFVDPACLAARHTRDTALVRSPEERVERFRMSVSDETYTLATCVSPFDLTLPLLSAVQRAVTEQPRLSQIAELLIGGLIRTVRPGRFDFAHGTRDVLRRRLSRDRFLIAFRAVLRHMEQTGAPEEHVRLAVRLLEARSDTAFEPRADPADERRSGPADALPADLADHLRHLGPLLKNLRRTADASSTGPAAAPRREEDGVAPSAEDNVAPSRADSAWFCDISGDIATPAAEDYRLLMDTWNDTGLIHGGSRVTGDDLGALIDEILLREGLVWIHIAASSFAADSGDVRPDDGFPLRADYLLYAHRADPSRSVTLRRVLNNFAKGPAHALLITCTCEEATGRIGPDMYDLPGAKDCLVLASVNAGARIEGRSPLAALVDRAVRETPPGAALTMAELRDHVLKDWRHWADSNGYARDNLSLVQAGGLEARVFAAPAESRSEEQGAATADEAAQQETAATEHEPPAVEQEPAAMEHAAAAAPGSAGAEVPFERVPSSPVGALPDVGLELLSAGEGTCQLIHVRKGRDRYAYLVDGGNAQTYRVALAARLEELRKHGVKVPLVALSHLDDDASRGVLQLLEGTRPRISELGLEDIWFNTAAALELDGKEQEAAGPREARLAEAAARLEIRLNSAFSGDAIWYDGAPPAVGLAGGARVTLLGPRKESVYASRERNRASLVLLFEIGNVSILTTGDASGDDIADAVAAIPGHSGPLIVDVLVLPHHGSRRMVTERLLAAVKPATVAVFPSHRFGNPPPETLERLQHAYGAVLVHFAQPLESLGAGHRERLHRALGAATSLRVSMPAPGGTASLLTLVSTAAPESAAPESFDSSTSDAPDRTANTHPAAPLADLFQAICLVLHTTWPDQVERGADLYQALGELIWDAAAAQQVRFDLEWPVHQWIRESHELYWQHVRADLAALAAGWEHAPLLPVLIQVARRQLEMHERMVPSTPARAIEPYLPDDVVERFRADWPEAPASYETDGGLVSLSLNIESISYLYRELIAALERLEKRSADELYLDADDVRLVALARILDASLGSYEYGVMRRALEGSASGDSPSDVPSVSWHNLLVPPWRQGQESWARLGLCRGTETKGEFLALVLQRVQSFGDVVARLSSAEQEQRWNCPAHVAELQLPPDLSAVPEKDGEVTLSGPLHAWMNALGWHRDALEAAVRSSPEEPVRVVEPSYG